MTSAFERGSCDVTVTPDHALDPDAIEVQSKIDLRHVLNGLPAGATVCFDDGVYDLGDGPGDNAVELSRAVTLRALHPPEPPRGPQEAPRYLATLKGSTSFVTDDGSRLFRISGPDVVIRDLEIQNFDKAIHVDGNLAQARNIQIIGNHFQNFGTKLVIVNAARHVQILNNRFDPIQAQTGGADVLSVNAESSLVRIQGNEFRGGAIPIEASYVGPILIYDNDLIRQVKTPAPPPFEGNFGIILFGGSGQAASDCSFSPQAPPFQGAVIGNRIKSDLGDPDYIGGWYCIVMSGLDPQQTLVWGNECENYAVSQVLVGRGNQYLVADNVSTGVLHPDFISESGRRRPEPAPVADVFFGAGWAASEGIFLDPTTCGPTTLNTALLEADDEVVIDNYLELGEGTGNTCGADCEANVVVRPGDCADAADDNFADMEAALATLGTDAVSEETLSEVMDVLQWNTRDLHARLRACPPR